MSRRPNNLISRHREMSLRAAELFDQGLGDTEVYKALKEEFPREKFSKRTVNSFYKASYEPIAQERLKYQRDARKVELLMSATERGGASYAEAAHHLLSKMAYKSLAAEDDIADKDLVQMGKMLAKVREIEIDKLKVEMQREKEQAARAIKNAVAGQQMTSEQLVHEVDKIMGLAR